MFVRYLHCLLLVACGLSLWGCAPGYPDTSPVQGTVTLEGKPLVGAEIRFISADGWTALGQVERDGTYRLMTFQPDDGAVPGTYRVVVQSPQVKGPTGDVTLMTIPERYADPETSGLRATVNAGFNSIDFNLEVDEEAGEGRAANEE